jgi:hypothetical protein
MSDYDPENEYENGGEGENGDPVTPEDVKRFLQQELSPEAFARVQEMLEALQSQYEAEDDGGTVEPGSTNGSQEQGWNQDRRRLGQDFPPPFKGRPSPGGAQDAGRGMRRMGAALVAMDARQAADYARRWPETKRLKIQPSDAQDSRAAVPSASYEARFGRVRIV